jgi:DNA invertase Pin-like site-specific DNA recombinase
MLTVLGGLAEFERELIRARTGEGRKRAKARGVRSVVRRTAPWPSAMRRWHKAGSKPPCPT